MRLFNFRNRSETEKLDKLFSDIEKNSFVVKKKSKSFESDVVVSIETYKAIKLSELKEILRKHFGISMKKIEKHKQDKVA